MTPLSRVKGKFGPFSCSVTAMDKDIVITLILAGLALFVWVPAIIWSVRRVLKSEKKTKK